MVRGSAADGMHRLGQLQQLPSELWSQVLCHVDSKTLVSCSCVCRRLKQLASDDALWIQRCDSLWETKRYVPDIFREEKLQPGCARRAFFGGLKDARRCRITADELCSFTWSFRFKKTAGRIWLRDDPYWQGHAARTLKFGRDGTVVWDGDFGDMRWTFAEGPDDNFEDGSNESENRGACERGTTVIVEHREMGAFPSEVVMRHSSWGFILNSPWVMYASFPLHKSDSDSEVSDRALRRRVAAWQWAEADDYNRQQAGSEEEDD